MNFCRPYCNLLPELTYLLHVYHVKHVKQKLNEAIFPRGNGRDIFYDVFMEKFVRKWFGRCKNCNRLRCNV